MRLSNTLVLNKKVNGVNVSTSELVKYLTSAKDMLADVYVNDKKVLTSVANIIEYNSHLVANISGLIALDDCTLIDHLDVHLRQATCSADSDGIMLVSHTELANGIICDTSDCNVDLYIKIVNTKPFETKCITPKSTITVTNTHKVSPITLSSQPDNPLAGGTITLTLL